MRFVCSAAEGSEVMWTGTSTVARITPNTIKKPLKYKKKSEVQEGTLFRFRLSFIILSLVIISVLHLNFSFLH